MSNIYDSLRREEPKTFMNKKRFRIAKSCSHCRKRKIKCDRHRPYCRSCVEEGNVENCKYESTPWLSDNNLGTDNIKLIKEVEELRLHVKYLEHKLESKDGLEREESSNYSNSVSTLNNMDSNSTIIGDKINLSQLFSGLMIKEKKLLYITPTACASLIMNDKYAKIIMNGYNEEQRKAFNNPYSLDIKTNECCGKKVRETNENVLQQNDSNKLPPYSIIMGLLDRFFLICFSFVPFIDQVEFMNDVKFILVDEGNYTSINYKGAQYGTISLVLLMLRFAYLSLPIKSYKFNDLNDDLDGLIEEIIRQKIVISSEYVNKATVLIFSSSFFISIHLSSIQAALLLRIYKMYCPEDYEGSTECNILIGMAIRMARIHGIHSERSQHHILLEDKRLSCFWKIVWVELLYLDASLAFNNGNYLAEATELEISDSFLEAFEENENLRHLLSIIQTKILITKTTRAFLMSITNKMQIFKADLEKFISDIEEILQKLQTFEQLSKGSRITNRETKATNLQEFIIRVDLTYKLFCSYVLLYNSVSEDNDILNNYISSALEYGLILFQVITDSLRDKNHLFGPEFENFVFTCLLLPCMRISLNMASIIMRIFNNENSMLHAVRNFTSQDSQRILKWININFVNETANARELFKVLLNLYNDLHNSKTNFLLSYMLRNALKTSLNFLEKSYNDSEFLSDEGNEPLSFIESKDLPESDQFWESKMNSYPLNNLDFLFSDFSDGFNDIFEYNL